jgi:hypothetical protein
VHPVPLPVSRGRLDRVAGPLAEPLRRILGRRMQHADSGGEWPQTLRHGDPRRPAIDEAVAALEQ